MAARIGGLRLLRGPNEAPAVSGVVAVFCKVTRAEVQFCVHLSRRIRSLFPAVQLSCLKPSCQLAESDRCTQPTDHHSSIGLAAFRQEDWSRFGVTLPYPRHGDVREGDFMF